MNHEIIHRGPDQDGFFVEKNEKFSISMAMRRLSIIDLVTGKQPIYSQDNQKIIVFNGEIYNYKDLREKYLKNYPFKTNSDTEVILGLYQKFGTDAFALLDGMFAFSIYDKTINKIFIARDFFGEKPLYYTLNNSTFYWASELKSIIKVNPYKPEISKHGLNLFFKLTYIPAPFTIYNNISKLEANHYLTFNCDDFTISTHEIKFPTILNKTNLSKTEAIKLNHDLVQKSVESRSVSEVPIGTFLSGGVDSSIISLCLAQQSEKKIDTFSVGFDKKSFDETDKSQLVAKLINSNHHEFILSEKDLAQNIDKIILNFDEPFADSSALPTYLVANKTKNHVTVALTGDGGDEVYGGYNKYYMGKLNANYTQIVPQKVHDIANKIFQKAFKIKDDSRGLTFKANKLLNAINYDGDFYYNIISLGFLDSERNNLLKNNYKLESPLDYFKNKIGQNNKTLTHFRNIDRLLSLEGDLLVKVDRASMLSSLECRAPFLNRELWDFTSTLPEKYLLNGWDKKHLLKESFKNYFPNQFLEKSKKGFGVPVGDWLRGSLKNELLHYTNKNFIEKQNIFEFEAISYLVHNHINSKVDNTFKIWSFYCFQKWYCHNFSK